MLLQLFSYPLEVYVAGHVVLVVVHAGLVTVPNVGGVPLHVNSAEAVPCLHFKVQTELTLVLSVQLRSYLLTSGLAIAVHVVVEGVQLGREPLQVGLAPVWHVNVEEASVPAVHVTVHCLLTVKPLGQLTEYVFRSTMGGAPHVGVLVMQWGLVKKPNVGGDPMHLTTEKPVPCLHVRVQTEWMMLSLVQVREYLLTSGLVIIWHVVGVQLGRVPFQSGKSPSRHCSVAEASVPVRHVTMHCWPTSKPVGLCSNF